MGRENGAESGIKTEATGEVEAAQHECRRRVPHIPTQKGTQEEMFRSRVPEGASKAVRLPPLHLTWEPSFSVWSFP